MKFLWIQKLPPFMKGCKSLHAQIIFWKPHNICALCWAFYCVNDNKEVNGKAHGVIYCMFCYNSQVDASNLTRIQLGKE
jgi:hypothetical protein